ncbi:MAG: hexitol phosphatase HxpB [Gemmatimonadaceae bacterium]|nr:hexitol phosphatase HxpB [Chitinophagaceae bacterium]
MVDTVIFDMDGLLIDSEPLWEEAGKETLKEFRINLTADQYHESTGLRSREWILHWFGYFGIDLAHAEAAENAILKKAIEKIGNNARPMPGAEHVVNLFIEKEFRIGIASSSPLELIEMVVQKLGIGAYITAKASAEHLAYGKPHPEVYLNCAAALGAAPSSCICFEDSFNGMIAAKAARMKCVVVPQVQKQHVKWGAADLKISSLLNFNELLLGTLR